MGERIYFKREENEIKIILTKKTFPNKSQKHAVLNFNEKLRGKEPRARPDAQ